MNQTNTKAPDNKNKVLREYTRKNTTINLLYKRGRQSFCLEAQKRFQREEAYFPTILSAQFILYITIYSNGLTWQILCHIHFF